MPHVPWRSLIPLAYLTGGHLPTACRETLISGPGTPSEGASNFSLIIADKDPDQTMEGQIQMAREFLITGQDGSCFAEFRLVQCVTQNDG